MNTPLVSVVCLCYNHERFVEEAIRSVLNQTYPSIQLIVVDDYSLDGSRLVIQKLLTHHPLVEFVPCEKNLGNCRAFNTGLAKVAGEFVIDLSADDVLMPTRVELGVREFLGRGLNYGVHFSDAELISDTDVILGHHSDQFPHDSIPQGDVFSEILSRYFINSPSMMMRKQVFDRLGGYDEALAYEDFDFWVRSSRDFQYCYTPEALVRKRVVNSSLGKRQYGKGSMQMNSTFIVCEKAFDLCKSNREYAALKRRILFETKQAIKSGNWTLSLGYLKLWWRIP